MEIARTSLNFLVVLLEVILIFNLLIVVHELGHFLAARWRGLVVEQFAVWFGKPLWKRTYNGVVYSLGSIPFGGFVKLPQMAPMDAIEGESTTDRAVLPNVSPLDKIIVALAGPVFSFGLAFLFAVLVWAVGRPVNEAETNLKIGYVVPDSPAAKAPCDEPGVPPGLHPGDKIIAVDGHKVSAFGGMNGSVVWYVARSEGYSIPFVVQRGDKTLTFQPVPLSPDASSAWRRRGLREVLIDPSYTSIVAAVKPGSPAQKAGLQENDVISEVDGKPLYFPLGLSESVEQSSYGQPIVLTVKRGTQTLPLTLAAMPFKIGNVVPGSPADRATLKSGDIIESVNGAPATKFGDLKAAILAHPGQAIDLAISHEGTSRGVSITPLVPKGKSDPMIGIGPDFEEDGIGWSNGGKSALVNESPSDQIRNSVATIGNTLGAVIAPKSHIGVQQLGGPLFIGRTYYYLLSSKDGWRLALWFSVILNVNLALLNMLPIPVLDGGHILLSLIEMVRRKPMNIRILEVVQTACFVVIAGYMLYVSFYDVGDLAGGRRTKSELEFPTPTPVPSNR